LSGQCVVQDDLPIRRNPRRSPGQTRYPNSYLAEGFIAGLVVEAALKIPPAAQAGAGSGRHEQPESRFEGASRRSEWTQDNHFRTKQYYRVWRWMRQTTIVRVQDWQAIEVKR
jgi:hypothetical protein